MYTLKDNDLGIFADRGQLGITTKEKILTIKEACLENYEQFFNTFLFAFKLIDTTKIDFPEAYLTVESFKDKINEALTYLGIDNPRKLTIRQLEALLINHQEKPGILFSFHQSYPKVYSLILTQN